MEEPPLKSRKTNAAQNARNAQHTRKAQQQHRTHKARQARIANQHTIQDARNAKTTKQQIHQQHVQTRLETRARKHNNRVFNSRLTNNDNQSLAQCINKLNDYLNFYSESDTMSNPVLLVLCV